MGEGFTPANSTPDQGKAIKWLIISISITLVVSFFLVQIFLYIAQFMGGVVIYGVALPAPLIITALLSSPQIIFYITKKYEISRKISKGVLIFWAAIALLIVAFIVWINIV